MKTVGISPKLRGPLAALQAAVVAAASTYATTGTFSDATLGAVLVALYTTAHVYFAKPGTVVTQEETA
jgi:hypothetical protein